MPIRLIFSSILLFAVQSLAKEKVLFVGTEQESGSTCVISIENQSADGNSIFYKIKYKSETTVVEFANEEPVAYQPLEASGLFEKNGKRYQEIIGAPLFPVGMLYSIDLSQTDSGFVLQTKAEAALLIGGIEIYNSEKTCL